MCVCVCVVQAPFGHHLPLSVLMATITSCVVGNVHFTHWLTCSPIHTHAHTDAITPSLCEGLGMDVIYFITMFLKVCCDFYSCRSGVSWQVMSSNMKHQT